MERLFRPVDNASLIAFRIVFGGLMLVAVTRYFAYGWIDAFYVKPALFFPFPGFEWIVPLPAPGMSLLYAGMGISALCVALGLWYRPAIALFAAAFTYAHLIDRTNYLNHYYLISLFSLLMLFLPLHSSASIDAWRRPQLRFSGAATWMIWLLRFQLGVVYFFGGLAKLNQDWLLRAQPLRIWLGANFDVPVLGRFFELPWVAYACSYAGLVFDLTIVWFLLCRRTRLAAYGMVVAFHLLTALLFPIGMFPWIMIGLTPIFFSPSWPRQLWQRLWGEGTAATVRTVSIHNASPRTRFAIGVALGAYALLQVGLPLRHWVRPGNVYWTEDGFRFAWQIMIMEKYGHASFRVTDSETGATTVVNPADYLTPLQARMMATQPDMLLSFARLLESDFRARGHRTVEVRADVYVSLNGRPHRRMIDPNVDLLTVTSGSKWVLPIDKQLVMSAAAPPQPNLGM